MLRSQTLCDCECGVTEDARVLVRTPALRPRATGVGRARAARTCFGSGHPGTPCMERSIRYSVQYTTSKTATSNGALP